MSYAASYEKFAIEFYRVGYVKVNGKCITFYVICDLYGYTI